LFSDLFLPANINLRKRSPIDDVVSNEKRRKLEDDSLSTPNTVNEIVKPIEKHVLELLNTPLVEKNISSPSITNYSSILKVHILLYCIIYILYIKISCHSVCLE
jgi:hypothetical protein